MRTLPALLLSIACLGAASEATLAGELFRRGDANDDSQLDISDASSVFRSLFLGDAPPACFDAADANDDGALNVSDGIFILNFLFRGGPAPPPPGFRGRCPGPDPTPDELDCTGGVVAPAQTPDVAIWPVVSNAPGVRQRSRTALEQLAPGEYAVPAGTSFAIVVEARANPVRRAGFTLHALDDPTRGDPDVLDVRCDQALGDPAAGGVPAGAPLAPHFFNELDEWEDRIYLLTHAALQVEGGGPLAPAPGEYVFSARVVDDGCASSPQASFRLVVEPSTAPRIRAWLESPEAPGQPLQHHPGTGNARIGSEGEWRLLVEALPNGRGGPPVDPASFTASATPDLDGLAAETDLAAEFAAVPGFAARWSLALEDGLRFPQRGNTELALGVEAADDARAEARVRIEIPLSHADDIASIWRADCTGCHENPDPEKGLVLVAPDVSRVFRNVVNVFAAEPSLDSVAPLLIWPYFPERSYLFHKVSGTHLDPEVDGEGDRMPADGSVLDVATLKRIEDWVLQGAAE